MVFIKSVQFFDHKIFGNQTFDFTINGKIANNIVLAGENGCGKTTLIEELKDLFIPGNRMITPKVSFINKTIEIILDVSSEEYYNFDNEDEKITEIIFTKGKKAPERESTMLVFKSKDKTINRIKKAGDSVPITSIRSNGVYSSVDINYKPRTAVTGITNDQTLDSPSNTLSNDIAYEITQLLVNLGVEDDLELADWVKNNWGKIPPSELHNIRNDRFIKSFKYIFEDKLTYKGIKNNSVPIFQRMGRKLKYQL